MQDGGRAVGLHMKCKPTSEQTLGDMYTGQKFQSSIYNCVAVGSCPSICVDSQLPDLFALVKIQSTEKEI